MNYTEVFVQRDQYRIYVREYTGEETAIILMHGLPDNLHLYDRLIPYLWPPRHVVTFDFLGWGESDKPPGYPYTSMNQRVCHTICREPEIVQSSCRGSNSSYLDPARLPGDHRVSPEP